MSDDSQAAGRGSFPNLYTDALWNLYSGAQVMKARLPEMADAIANQELATLLRDTLGQASHAAERLQSMLARFTGPARVHAVELETLVGDASRRLADWPSGDSRDVAVSTVVRCAIHTAIPGCELAIVLGEAIGFAQHADELRVLLAQMRTTDENVRVLSEQRVRAAHPAP